MNFDKIKHLHRSVEHSTLSPPYNNRPIEIGLKDVAWYNAAHQVVPTLIKRCQLADNLLTATANFSRAMADRVEFEEGPVFEEAKKALTSAQEAYTKHCDEFFK